MKKSITRTTSIPFFGNWNNVSCCQCAYKMAMEFFSNKKTWSCDEMDKFCDARPSKGTWPFAPICNLADLGFEVIVHTNFNSIDFALSPESYLKSIYDTPTMEYIIQYSDIDSAVLKANLYNEKIHKNEIQEIKGNFTSDIIESLLKDGYLIAVWVNANILNNTSKSEVEGHFILIHNYNSQGFFAHDPGGNKPDGTPSNQYQNRYISHKDLITAASHADKKTDDMVAIRKKKET